jgi:integrating conjugative element protein (TIGR03752 family)
MKKNTGLKVLSGAVVGVVALILMNHGERPPTEPVRDPNNLNEAIASQFNDNIRDVAARLQETEKKLEILEKQKPVTEAPTPHDGNPELANDIRVLKDELNQLKESRGQSENYESSNTVTDSGIHDIDKLLMKHENNATEHAYWERLKTKPIVTLPKPTLEKPKAIPYYTIPAGSDLGHTTLLSALIGEVPSEGKLMQPLFPFSAVISRGDLMAANGIPLPANISGMKINGYAIGVGSFLDNISCVRAYATSALFVFDDGHFVTVGKEQMNGTAELVNNDSLGYLTTPYGNPCIKGKYFTNAPQVLTAMMAAGGIQGLGTTISQWQTTTTSGTDGARTSPTGSFGKYALGGALSEGSVKAGDWLEKRIQGSFDMVFVPASIGNQPNHVSFHLTQTINLDKEENGRLLDYGNEQKNTHDFSLK